MTMGTMRAMAEDDGLMKGLNTYRGQVTYQAVADYFGLAYTPYEA